MSKNLPRSNTMTSFFKAAVATLVLSGAVLANEPTPQEKANQAALEQMGQMLHNLGYESTRGTYTNGAIYFDIQVPRAEYTAPVRVSLSPNGRVFWLTVSLTPCPDDVSAERLTAVLQAINAQTGKAQMVLTNKHLVAKYPLDNVALSPARVRFAIDDFMSGVESSRKAWDFGASAKK